MNALSPYSTFNTSQPSSSSSSNPHDATPPTASMSLSTPLGPTTDPTGYVFPVIWNFPPFFTVFWLDVDAADGGEGCRELFWNRGINRRLLPPMLKQLTSHLLKSGHLGPDPPKQTGTYLIYWRKPEEWGQIIYHWVNENGLTGSIMTFYEITEGDMAHTTDFHLLPIPLLRRALDTLAKQGKAQIFKGDDTGDGVKFF